MRGERSGKEIITNDVSFNGQFIHEMISINSEYLEATFCHMTKTSI